MDFNEIISTLPSNPGVYRFLNGAGEIIYIGKAKNLRKRVSQYFADPLRLTPKTKALVSNIARIEHTVVESEQDAFLLENNLIKHYKPKYNIMLKDSKTYPWICISNQPFPRIFLTRRLVKDGSIYFGPYSSVQYAHSLLDLINTLYKLRNCNLNLRDISGKGYKVCLNYHIKKCCAPCVGNISREKYDSFIEDIVNLLKGNTSKLIREMRENMSRAAAELDFETAQEYKEKIELLSAHYNKSLIVHPEISNVDVFSIVIDNYNVFGNYLKLNNGCIIQALNLQLKMNIEEYKSEVLSRFISEIYTITAQDSRGEILVPFMPDMEFPGTNIHIPLRGDKLALLELSTKNANAFKYQQLKQEALNAGERHSKREDRGMRAVEMLRSDLNMSIAPAHIECFDNSNIQGTNPVASCVVFKNGKPSKKDYRHFNIKTVVGANDFASMYEVVFRRYSRLVQEGKPLPQLILIDGGRGQLNFAYRALQDLQLEKRIKIIGIAKRLEELVIPDDPTPLFLDKSSPSLKLLMNLRDEAHRFGITHHRGKRSKGQINSALREIYGIGETTETKLLQHFKSVKRIREATAEEIAAIAGKRAAALISKAFGEEVPSNENH